MSFYSMFSFGAAPGNYDQTMNGGGKKKRAFKQRPFCSLRFQHWSKIFAICTVLVLVAFLVVTTSEDRIYTMYLLFSVYVMFHFSKTIG